MPTKPGVVPQETLGTKGDHGREPVRRPLTAEAVQGGHCLKALKTLWISTDDLGGGASVLALKVARPFGQSSAALLEDRLSGRATRSFPPTMRGSGPKVIVGGARDTLVSVFSSWMRSMTSKQASFRASLRVASSIVQLGLSCGSEL